MMGIMAEDALDTKESKTLVVSAAPLDISSSILSPILAKSDVRLVTARLSSPV